MAIKMAPSAEVDFGDEGLIEMRLLCLQDKGQRNETFNAVYGL